MANLLTMPLWQFGLIFLGFLFAIIVIVFIYFIFTKKKRQFRERQKLNVLISAFRDGLNLGYSKIQIAKKAMNSGWELYECNRALKYLKEEPI